MVYKWDNPVEWLNEKIRSNDWDLNTLKESFVALASYVDSDAIQECFEDDMDTDGYFDDEPEGPDEGDYTTEDHIHFYHYGKLVLTVEQDATSEEMNEAIRAHMEKEQFFPSVWFISDHGNADLMTLTVD